MSKGQSLQDPFLNALRRERVPVSIYLVNGIKLQGTVESFDQFVVLLRNTVSQMVYKHAISTVVPSRNVRVGGPRKAVPPPLVGTRWRWTPPTSRPEAGVRLEFVLAGRIQAVPNRGLVSCSNDPEKASERCCCSRRRRAGTIRSRWKNSVNWRVRPAPASSAR